MKRTLILSVLLSCTMTLFSQAFTGGLMAGVVASQVGGDTYSGYNKAGAALGGYVNLLLSEDWSVQMELEYIMKGSRHIENTDKPGDITYKLNLNYMEVPVLVQYRFFKKWNVQAGLSGSVLMSKKETIDGADALKYGKRPGFISKNFNMIFGFVFPLNERFKVDIRTVNSINPVRKGEIGGYVKRFGKEYGQFNDILLLSIFYRI